MSPLLFIVTKLQYPVFIIFADFIQSESYYLIHYSDDLQPM